MSSEREETSRGLISSTSENPASSDHSHSEAILGDVVDEKTPLSAGPLGIQNHHGTGGVCDNTTTDTTAMVCATVKTGAIRSGAPREQPLAVKTQSGPESSRGGSGSSVCSDCVPWVAHVAHRYEGGEHHHQKRGCLSALRNLIPHGGLSATTFNFVAATLGAGVLGLPSAMQSTGIVVGTIALLVICACTIFSLRLLVKIFDRFGYVTYEEMARHFIHPRFGDKIAAFLFIAFCWGTTVAYVRAIGDILMKISEVSWFPAVFRGTAGGDLLVIIFWTVVLLPVSLCKEVNSLRYISLLGIFCTLFLMASIIAHAANDPASSLPRVKLATFDSSMIAALPVFVFSYCCQVNVFEIYTELKPRTVKRLTATATASMSLCTVFYIGAGIAGAVNFGGSVRGNILKNYNPTESVYILITYCGCAINLSSSFPLCIYPTRDAIVQLMGYPSAYAAPTAVRMTLCAFLAFMSLLCGLYVPGIQVMFGVLGGLCGSSVGFIFPALFTLRSPGYNRRTAGTVEYVCVWLLLIFGVIACFLGTITSIIQTASG